MSQSQSLVTLKKLVAQLEKNSPTLTEDDHLNVDLQAMITRLNSGNYKDSHFLNRNVFDVPRRTQEFLRYLESYACVGKTLKSVIENTDLNQKGKVIDLCAGWAPKVPLALYYYNFEGELILLDQDTKSLETVQNFMQLFNHNYNISLLPQDFWNSKQKTTFDLVIANHIIDDLAVDCYQDYIGKKVDIYQDEKVLKQLWKALITDTEFTEIFFNLLSKQLCTFAVKPGTHIIITQYQSLIEKLLKLEDVSTWNKEIFKRLKKHLTQSKFQLKPTPKLPADSYFKSEDVMILKRI